jgi:hypothetical protein
MLTIQHRINTSEQLSTIPIHHGIEIDIRSYGDELQLAHDPFVQGESLESLLQRFKHRLVIFNVKCDGLESQVMDLAQKYNITDYFFLDVAMPTLVKLVRRGERRIAVRFSEYEPLSFVMGFAGLVDWVWVDCFSRLPLDDKNIRILKQTFKLCLVSPELVGRPEETPIYKKLAYDMGLDAVCTDLPDQWD